MENTLTEKQIVYLSQMFASFDKDEDGELSFDEFNKCIKNLTNFHIQTINDICEIDVDNNGTISLNEFLLFIDPTYTVAENVAETVAETVADSVAEPVVENDLMTQFKKIDTNSDGFISAAELKDTMKGLNMDLTDEDIDMMIAKVDIDGDGQINYEEFVKMMM